MDIKHLIEEGIALFQVEQYLEVIDKLTEALKEITDITEISDQLTVHNLLGICYFKQAEQSQDTGLFEKAREHFEKHLQLAQQLDGKNGIQQQVNAQYWLGQCYFKQAEQSQDTELFNKAREHFEDSLKLAQQLDGENGIQEQVNAQYWLGLCYFKQAEQSQDTELFNEAREHFEDSLKLAQQLRENGIQKQVDAQFLLGLCYFKQVEQNQDTGLLEKAREHFEDSLKLAQQLDGENGIQEQVNAQYWLGQCYLKQVEQSQDTELFNEAREHFEDSLKLAQQLDGEDGVQGQVYAQYWLGQCYLKQVEQSQDTELFNEAREHFEDSLKLAQQLDGEDGVQGQVYAQVGLGRCYLEQAKQIKRKDESSNINEQLEKSEKYFNQIIDFLEKNKNTAIYKDAHSNMKIYLGELKFLNGEYPSYFDDKKSDIQDKLPKELICKEEIASILAVLSIEPIEFNQPLAHYTSPYVCEKLLGIGQRQEAPLVKNSKMRMNSSSYMNDPYEGKSLADFLGMQEISLENKTDLEKYNAFFTCFSARVNDLNQFRLYGKVNNVEASGCCLVFNKKQGWIKKTDILLSHGSMFGSINRNSQENSIVESSQPSENFPLYQIAYIFYRDEYTKLDEHDIFCEEGEFGVRLKPISNNDSWHEIRRDKLKQALIQLKEYFQANQKQTNNQSSDAKLALEALEYIRYLFKDYAFRDEEEFRLLCIEKLDSENVQYCSATNSVYIEYDDICGKVDEVILGTNYEHTEENRKIEVFHHLVKKKQLNITVSHSSLPIASRALYSK